MVDRSRLHLSRVHPGLCQAVLLLPAAVQPLQTAMRGPTIPLVRPCCSSRQLCRQSSPFWQLCACPDSHALPSTHTGQAVLLLPAAVQPLQTAMRGPTTPLAVLLLQATVQAEFPLLAAVRLSRQPCSTQHPHWSGSAAPPCSCAGKQVPLPAAVPAKSLQLSGKQVPTAAVPGPVPAPAKHPCIGKTLELWRGRRTVVSRPRATRQSLRSKDPVRYVWQSMAGRAVLAVVCRALQLPLTWWTDATQVLGPLRH